MSFATAFGSLVCKRSSSAISRQQADYDAVLRAAQNPRDRAEKLAREARFDQRSQWKILMKEMNR